MRGTHIVGRGTERAKAQEGGVRGWGEQSMPSRELQMDIAHLEYRVGVRLEGRGPGDEAG